MTAQERFPRREYEAKVIKVIPYNKQSFDDGGKIIFQLDNGESVAYHIKGINKIDSDISLKSVGYYLNYPYSYGQRYDQHKLLNRCCVVIINLERSKKNSNQVVPVIIDFKFCYNELFSYNSNNTHQ